MAYVFESVPAQRSRVDMSNPSEVMYWAKQFGCSQDQLRATGGAGLFYCFATN